MHHTICRGATAFGIALAALAVAPSAQSHGDAPHSASAKPEQVDTAFGRTGDRARVTRTIRVSGNDTMRFTPSRISVRQGETIRFVVRNDGRTQHEMVLGTLADLKQHAEWMLKNPKMEHQEPYMAHVAPGKSGEIVWTFDKPGEFHFGCLVAGHFEAGMQGTITVTSIEK